MLGVVDMAVLTTFAPLLAVAAVGTVIAAVLAYFVDKFWILPRRIMQLAMGITCAALLLVWGVWYTLVHIAGALLNPGLFALGVLSCCRWKDVKHRWTAAGNQLGESRGWWFVQVHVYRPLAFVRQAGMTWTGLWMAAAAVFIGVPSLALAACVALLRLFLQPPSMLGPLPRTP